MRYNAQTYMTNIEIKTMLRPAKLNEVDLLNKLIEQSVRALSREEYTVDEIESAIRYIFGVDTELVEDETYYVIEEDGIIQACGGWSKRKTLYGGSQYNLRESGYLDPATDAAKIRAFFVHPDYARRGLGTKLIHYCEAQAFAQGFKKIEMMATLPGVKLYQTCGYTAAANKTQVLHDGVSLKLVHMIKELGEGR